MQRKYIRTLQRHWGLKLDFPFCARPLVDAPIFHRDSANHVLMDGVLPSIDIPKEYQVFDKMKIFVILVSVPEKTYKGSFSIELISAVNPGVVVYRVSFLRRGGWSRCGACREREESNSGASGMMILDTDEIYELLAGAGLNTKDVEDEDVLHLIRTTFFARIVTPGGKALAEGHHQSSTMGSKKTLPESGIPKLAFYSASVAHYMGDDEDEDVQFCDWQPHTDILGKHWVDMRDW